MVEEYVRRTCPRCKGKGSIDAFTKESVTRHTKYATTCPCCEGKGYIKYKEKTCNKGSILQFLDWEETPK